ncbi:hypothetical protein Tco_0064587 [Tanacetum coccineum]
MSNMYEDPIYDEVGTSYDSSIPSEVQDQDNYSDNVDEYYQEHEMQSDVQHNYVVNSDADYTSDSNIIMYDQYMEDNEEHGVQSMSANKQVKVVNDTLTSELARYKELVGEYEKRAKFKLTEREQKIDEQMRIIIFDRNRKETSLKSELHTVQMQLRSILDQYKSKTEEVTILKKDLKKTEDKHLEEFLDMKKLKDKVEDRLYKQDQSVQTVHMLCRPNPFYDEKKKMAIGYKNPLCLTHAKQVQSALYNGTEIFMTNHKPAVVHDSEETLEIAKLTRKRMYEKMKSPLYENDRKKVEASVLKPLSTPTVYPPNTPVKLVSKVLFKEVKEMEEIFDQMSAEVDQNTVDKQCVEIERKNLLIANENLISNLSSTTDANRSKPRSNTKKNRILPTKSENKMKVEDHPRKNKSVWIKVNQVESSISSKRVIINSNSESACKTCNKCLIFANHDMCVIKPLNSVNATPTVKNSLNKVKQVWKVKGKLFVNCLNKAKQVWKATSKVFANVGYQWRPTRKKFTLGKHISGHQWRPTGKMFLLGERCPLTRLPVKCCTDRPLVSGLRLFKTYDGESFKAQEVYEKVPREIQASFFIIMAYVDVSSGPAPHRKEKCTLQCALSLKEEKSSWENRPEPMSTTPGQFSSGLIPNQVHATNYVLPTDKDLELLFQHMFDEYFEVTRVDEPVPSATTVNAQVVPLCTSVFTTFAQDAPSTSYSPSSFEIQPPVIHHDVAV